MTTKNAESSPRSLSNDSNVQTNLRKSFDVFSNLEVSFFTRVDSVKPEGKRRLGDILGTFRGDDYRARVEHLRTLPEPQYKLKKTQLAAITFSGTFSQRGNNHLISVTNLMCLDFDNVESPEQFRDGLKFYPWIYAAWISPSGKGVKCLVAIPSVASDQEFKKVFKQIKKVFPAIDASCSDIARLCFVSWDPGLWTNPSATLFELSFDHFEEVKPTIPNTDLTPLNDFNQRGDERELLERHQWTFVKSVGSNDHYCRPGKQGTTSATWSNEKRLFYVFTSSTQLEPARAYNLSALLCYLECSGDFSETAKRLSETGYGERSQRTQAIVPTIKLPAGIQFNIITHGLTFDGKPLSNKKLHDLWWDAPKRPGFDNYYHQLIALAPAWNPYTDFFNVGWSGVDQFAILDKFIETDDGFTKELKRHIIRGINQLLGEPGSKNHHINRFAFILQGGMNIGKSEFLRRLTLRDFLPGFSSEIDMGQSKTEVHRLLCQCVNLINEEIDSVTAQEVRSLKPIISYSGGSLRLPYDRTPTQMQRIATLWGSVNPGEFLLETNDRWIVYEIRKIDFGYTAAVDFADLWRQCYAEWKRNPLAGELRKSEVDELSEKASAHLIVSPLEQFVISRYVGDVNVKPMTMHEIRADVIGSYQNVNDKQLGRVMMAAFGKFRAGRQMINGVRGTLYCVRVKNNLPMTANDF